jgi:hypothetical protein
MEKKVLSSTHFGVVVSGLFIYPWFRKLHQGLLMLSHSVASVMMLLFCHFEATVMICCYSATPWQKL